LTDIYLYLTGRCNLRCSHCWIAAGEGPGSDSELTAAEVQDVIDQAIPLGLRAVKITGGEPFIRDDILDILDYAASRGLRTRVETNGTLLDDPTADKLAGLHDFHAGVSLDGATAETHARLRGSQEAFHAAVKGIEALVSRGVSTEIITVVHRGNLHEIEEITAMAGDLGIGLHKINQLNDVGRGHTMIGKGRTLSIEQTLAFNRFVEDHLNVAYDTDIFFDIPIVFRSPDIIGKFAGARCRVQNILGVLADGRLSICGIGETTDELVFANVREATVREVWERNGALGDIRQRVESERDGLCQRCMLRRYCIGGHCRALTYARYGSFSAPYPFCRDAFEADLFPSSRLLDAESEPWRGGPKRTRSSAAGCRQLERRRA
jgi:SynChlorMet cassette radical SAM/SPASM protein ScmF